VIFLAVAASIATVRPAIAFAGAPFGVVKATAIAALCTAILRAATSCLARFAGPISATLACAILRAATRMLARFAGRIAAAEHTAPASCYRPAGAAVLGAGIKVFAAVATSVAAGGTAIILAGATFVAVATVVAAQIVAILIAGTCVFTEIASSIAAASLAAEAGHIARRAAILGAIENLMAVANPISTGGFSAIFRAGTNSLVRIAHSIAATGPASAGNMPVAAIRRAGTWVLARVADPIAAKIAVGRAVRCVLAAFAFPVAAFRGAIRQAGTGVFI